MRLSTTALLASVFLAPAGAAWAQATGNDVSVNPVPTASKMLLYPGGQYMRVVHPLLQPGETARDLGRITLHMPRKATGARVSAARTPTVRQAAAEPAPPPAPRAVTVAPAPVTPHPVPPKPAPANNPAPNSPAFGAPRGAAGLNIGNLSPPPASASQPPAPTKQMAKAEPASPIPASTAPEAPTPGLTKRSVILFAADATAPAQSALSAIKFLAGDLNASMTTPASRVQLLAYGGPKGDKSSDARRLSLKRALAIRQVLIDDGVPSERIDVRAMGGVDDGGPADRVDVFVKS
jgi:outer membrane protein OmpA-like peptidoglycan-associated protein